MSDSARARQARVHALLTSGSSVGPGGTALENSRSGTVGSGGSGHSDSPPSSARSSSSSHTHTSSSRNRRRQQQNHNGNTDPNDVALRFSKVAVNASPATHASSTLTMQLQLARASDGEFHSNRQRVTVYLPHDEGAMVCLEIAPNCTAHELVIEALKRAREENDGEIPSGLLDDPYSYRVYAADEAGEVDDDYPVLGLNAAVCSLNVESFVLRDRVDAARPAAASMADEQDVVAAQNQYAGGRSSIVLGPGGDHSSLAMQGNKKQSGFASLETDGDANGSAHEHDAANQQVGEIPPQCCHAC